MKEQEQEKKSYTSPTVEPLGAVRELTLGSRDDRGGDDHGHGHNY
jgi:hypothetical protein